MSDYFFCIGNGMVADREAARIERAIRDLGVHFVRHKDAAGRRSYWFAAPNRGEPYASEIKRRTMQAVGAVECEA